MLQPGERIVDPLGREGREGARLARGDRAHSVHDVIMRGREVGDIEDVAQREIEPAVIGHGKGGRAAREMQRNGRGGGAHPHRHAVVADHEVDLGRQVVGKEVGPRDGRGIDAGLGDVAERQPAVDLVEARDLGLDLGIEGAHARRRAPLGQGTREGRAQKGGRAIIAPRQLGHRLGARGKALLGLGRGGCRGHFGVHSGRLAGGSHASRIPLRTMTDRRSLARAAQAPR